MYAKNPFVLLAISKEKTFEKNGQFLELFYLQLIFLAPLFFFFLLFHSYFWSYTISQILMILLYSCIYMFFLFIHLTRNHYIKRFWPSLKKIILISSDPTVTLSGILRSHIVNTGCEGREGERESGQGQDLYLSVVSLFLRLELLHLNQWNWSARNLQSNLEKKISITNTGKVKLVEDRPGTPLLSWDQNQLANQTTSVLAFILSTQLFYSQIQ